MKKEMMYEAPVVETIEVNIEKGFATSGGGSYDGTAGVGGDENGFTPFE